MKSIIEVKNLSKKYQISHTHGGYVALRDVIAETIKHPFHFLKQKTKQMAGIQTKEDFWALKDVNFTVEKGEAVGIIGSNGAGKSTLLKILSQITPPTEGEVIMRGKVGSLLEVGTGFHPELTGRENIFLNGAILGMTKKEIAKKFDNIVEFSGVEKFLDTPVKRYSSGMYVRLAFAVAAHMEPDILIIDEVLAVGDAEFQKKCLGKMEEVTRGEGRTILFVSHNLPSIERLCTKVVILNQGAVEAVGPTKEMLSLYLKRVRGNKQSTLATRTDRRGSGEVQFSVCNTRFDAESKSLFVHMEYTNFTKMPIPNVKISFDIYNENDVFISNITNTILQQRIDLDADSGSIDLRIDGVNLDSGIYHANIFLARDNFNTEIFDWVFDAVEMDIDNDNFYGDYQKLPLKNITLFKYEYK